MSEYVGIENVGENKFGKVAVLRNQYNLFRMNEMNLSALIKTLKRQGAKTEGEEQALKELREAKG